MKQQATWAILGAVLGIAALLALVALAERQSSYGY